jgi:hypothetical protein
MALSFISAYGVDGECAVSVQFVCVFVSVGVRWEMGIRIHDDVEYGKSKQY